MNKRRLMFVGAMASAVAPLTAFAQDEGRPQEAASSNEIIVTAQRRAENQKDVPISIVAQTGADLKAAGISNLRDLGVVAPGLAFTSQGPFAEPNIRGVSTTLSQAGAESPIAIYIDGVYQPNQIGNLFDLPDVAQVEVLKGPQGTLFGRNATGGAIMIHTRDPEYKTTGSLSVDVGSFTGDGVKSAIHVRTSAFVTTPLVEDVLAVSLSGSYEYTPGYLIDVLTGDNTGLIRSWTTRGKVLFEPTDTLHFLVSGYYSKRKDGSGSVAATTGVSVASQYPDAVLPTRPWQVASEMANSQQIASTTSRGVSLKADLDVGEAGTLSSLTSYSYTNGLILSEVDGAYSPSCVAVFACISPYVVEFGPSKTFQQEVTFTSKDLGPVHFTVGGLYYSDKSALSSWVNPPLVNGQLVGSAPYGAPYYTNTYVKTKALAGFGELTWNVTDALHLTGGLRYSWEERSGFGSALGGPTIEFGNNPHWTSWTPRISLRYDVTPEANVYATYSKGFKSGVLNALNLSDDIAQPEKLTSYEVGAKFSNSRASLNVAAFYYDYRDLQIQFFLGLANTIGNADSARIYGFDIDGSFKLTDDLSIRAAGSWVPHAAYRNYTNGVAFVFPMGPFGLTTDAAVDASGLRVLKTPRFTGNVTLNYDHEVGSGGKLDGNLTFYYSSGFNWNLVERARTTRYATISAQVGYTPVDSGARFGLYVRNLTNKAYVTSTTLSAQGDTYGYGAPREIGASLSYQF